MCVVKDDYNGEGGMPLWNTSLDQPCEAAAQCEGEMYITQEWFNVNLVRNFVITDVPAVDSTGTVITTDDGEGNMVPTMTTACIPYDPSVNPPGFEGLKSGFSW
jgi:hypothetical protein